MVRPRGGTKEQRAETDQFKQWKWKTEQRHWKVKGDKNTLNKITAGEIILPYSETLLKMLMSCIIVMVMIYSD